MSNAVCVNVNASGRWYGILCLACKADVFGNAVHVYCSWLGKIQTVKELLVDNADRGRPGLDALAYAYIYLQVLSLLTSCLLHTLCCHDKFTGTFASVERAS